MRAKHFLIGLFIIFCYGCATSPAPTLLPASPPQPTLSERVMPQVMTLVARNSDGKKVSQGSGFIWNQDYLITNAHVVAGAAWVEFYTEAGAGRGSAPYAIYIDVERDIAVLHWQHQESGLVIADIIPPRGTTVYAFGAPLGLEGTMSDGIISAIREIDQHDYIQTTAAISPGSSGGPLVNAKGEVVGVITSYMTQGQNLNLAIPASMIASLPLNTNERISFPASMDDEDNEEIAALFYELATAEEITANQAITGYFARNSFVFKGSYLHFYSIELEKTDSISLELESNIYKPHLFVWETDSFFDDSRDTWTHTAHSTSNRDLELTFSPPTGGTYFIAVESPEQQTGSYQFTVSKTPLLVDGRWLLIGQSDGTQTYLDLKSTDTSGYFLTAWVQMKHEQKNYAANETYNRTLSHWRINCSQMRYQINAFSFYNDGAHIGSDKGSSEWSLFIPGTLGERLGKAACALK